MDGIHKAKGGHIFMRKNLFPFCMRTLPARAVCFFYQVRANVVVSDWFQFLIHIHNSLHMQFSVFVLNPLEGVVWLFSLTTKNDEMQRLKA